MILPSETELLPGTLREIVREVTGSYPTRMRRQGGGLSNLAFQVEASGEAFVMRVGEGSKKLAGFKRERRAATLARGSGIPAQQIVAVGNHGFWAYTVALKVRGHPAKESQNRSGVLQELGWIASRIHTIATDGYGANFSAVGEPLSVDTARTWTEFLFDEWDAAGRLQRLGDYQLLTRRQQSILTDTLDDVRTWTSQPVLNHGDLRLKNVLVDENARIAGLIDWETTMSVIGPHWDMSVALHDLSIDDKESFLRGYGMNAQEIHQWSRVWRMFNVLNYATHVEHLVQRGEWPALDTLRTRLSGALEMYVQG